MSPRDLFTEDDRRRIADAVGRAEERSRGEIVTAVTASSDDYDGALWRGATFGALAGPLALALLAWASGWWGGPNPWIMVLAAAGGCALALLLVRSSDTVVRWLTSDDEIELRVERAARSAFLDHEVFATRDRSGVLLFLSLLERRVVVLGDVGVDAVVEPGEWAEIVAGIVAGIRAGRPADALIEAVERCGVLLERTGLDRRPDDEDELSNEVHFDGGEDDGGGA